MLLDSLIMLFFMSLILLGIVVVVKVIGSRNRSKQKWDELDDKIEEIRKTIAKEWD